MSIIYKNEISVDEVNYLRKSVGFRQILPEQINDGLNGSAYIVSTYDNDKIVGMARLIWDGGMVALIRDMIVLPEYRNLSIDQEMINRILDFLRSKLLPGYGIQVDVMAWNGDESIYEELGFCYSLPEKRGIPMHICLSNQIEFTDAKYKQCSFSDKQ